MSSSPSSDSETLTTGEVAEFCGVRPVTVIRWVKKGILKAHQLKQFVRALATLPATAHLTHHRHFDVFACIERGDEVVHLEDEANRARAERIEVPDLRQILPVDEYPTACGAVQSPEQIEQRGFP